MRILLISCVMCMFLTSYSQVRHVKGIEMVSAGMGIISGGNNFEISYQRYIDRMFSIKTSGLYETVYVQDFQYGLYAIAPSGYLTLLSNKRNFYLNLEGGVIIGVDRLKSEAIGLEKEKFVIGQSIGLNFELFIQSNVKLDFTFSQRFFEKNQNEEMGSCLGASISFKI